MEQIQRKYKKWGGTTLITDKHPLIGNLPSRNRNKEICKRKTNTIEIKGNTVHMTPFIPSLNIEYF